MTRRKLIVLVAGIIAVIGGVYGWRVYDRATISPRDSDIPIVPTEDVVEQQVEESNDESKPRVIETVANNLSVPWEIAVLPNGDFLVTERTGTIQRLGANTATFTVERAQQIEEGGLLGLVLDPNFETNNFIYVYLTSSTNSSIVNSIERYTLGENSLNNRKIILDQIPGAIYHDGGRIAFGPDGKLYATTGDANNPSSAQDTNSLAGKILRMNADGSAPGDNPFGNLVWSYGHRNPQGIEWDSQGRLWSSEHGPSGTGSGFDEVNLITKGANYGWPLVQGDQTGNNLTPPVIQSGASDTWAPADIAIHNNIVYFSGLRGEAVYKATINGDRLDNLQRMFVSEYGRIRATVIHDDYLFISTSNTDGRGNPVAADDRIIKIPL